MRPRPLELLSESLRRHKTDNDVYHDLMAFRVREVLLVATAYDAFVLEEEDRLAEQIFGEYHQLSLSSAPRITGAASGGEALAALAGRSFDMVILTTRIDESAPLELARRIRASHPSLPVLLLLRESSEIPLVAGRWEPGLLDGVFIWNGDAKIFLAMIKLVEDRANVATDTAIGLVRVILLVEDSIRYASRYLPLLYSEIMKQIQALIGEERLDEAKKLLRMRARPKVLLARTYEEAVAIVGKHRDHLLCLISDVAFARGGTLDEQAGVRLIEAAREMLPDLPILVQSFERGHAATARALGADFLDKNADNLSAGLTAFVFERLGFGDFVFRDREGLAIGRARTLDELRALLPGVPDESLVYHAERNQFSAWLMARGEIRIAREIQPIRVSDFPSTADMRQRLIGVLAAVQAEKTRGQVLPFDEALLDGRSAVLRLAAGSLGGRGRAIAFVHMLIEDCRLGAIVDGMSVAVPPTAVIGTEEYARFIVSNGLADLFGGAAARGAVEERFLAGSLSAGLRDRLRRYLARSRRPLSVRPTGLFEDSAAQPFAGAYETLLLANNAAGLGSRLEELERAIKLAFASVLSDRAAAALATIGAKSEEEKIAVVLQEVVGGDHQGLWYPMLSGVAASHDYYPPPDLRQEDGAASLWVGLGAYLRESGPAFRFSPRAPRVDRLSPDQELRDGQTGLWVLDLSAPRPAGGSDLKRMPVADADAAALRLCVSTWDAANGRFEPGDAARGPRVANFAPILKYDAVPLAPALEGLLDVLRTATGAPVEIEFAMEGAGAQPRLYVLGARSIGGMEAGGADASAADRGQLLMRSEHARGNGRIGGLFDVVFAAPRRLEARRSAGMARELAEINRLLAAERRPCILIAPGRWGSRDPGLGIPVTWDDISQAKILVEIELADFRVDPSFGSHFLNQIVSMNVGYLSVPWGSETSFVDWDWLLAQEAARRAGPSEGRTGRFVHLRFERPLEAIIDGRKGHAVLRKPA